MSGEPLRRVAGAGPAPPPTPMPTPTPQLTGVQLSALEFWLGWFADPIYGPDGDYPPAMRRRASWDPPAFTPAQRAQLRGSAIFFGLNAAALAAAAAGVTAGPDPVDEVGRYELAAALLRPSPAAWRSGKPRLVSWPDGCASSYVGVAALPTQLFRCWRRWQPGCR